MTDLGRPRDAFGDPVIRLRSWAFDQRLRADSGLDSPSDLAHQFGIKPAHFAFLQLDGADPQRLQVKEGSLIDAMAAHPQGEGACQDYLHPLWDGLLLAKRTQSHPLNRDLRALDRQIKAFGLVRVTLEDLDHGEILGLLTRADSNRKRDAEALHLDASRFASWDGVDVLHRLFLQAIDDNAYRFAAVFAEILEDALKCVLFEHWPDNAEVRDTWHWVLHSRMLAWRPLLRPTPQQLEQAWRRWAQMQIDQGAQYAGDLAKDIRRIPRRVRRKVLMSACAQLHAELRHPAHYNVGDDRLFWLVENRELIREHYVVAWPKIHNHDVPPTAPLAGLTMPADLFDDRIRPQPQPRVGWYKIDRLFDAIPVIRQERPCTELWENERLSARARASSTPIPPASCSQRTTAPPPRQASAERA